MRIPDWLGYTILTILVVVWICSWVWSIKYKHRGWSRLSIIAGPLIALLIPAIFGDWYENGTYPVFHSPVAIMVWWILAPGSPGVILLAREVTLWVKRGWKDSR